MLRLRDKPDRILNRYNFPVSMEGCVLYLPLGQEDMQGSSIISYDQYHHSCAVTGTLWTPQGRDFNGASDRLDLADTIVPDTSWQLTRKLAASHSSWGYPSTKYYWVTDTTANKVYRLDITTGLWSTSKDFGAISCTSPKIMQYYAPTGEWFGTLEHGSGMEIWKLTEGATDTWAKIGDTIANRGGGESCTDGDLIWCCTYSAAGAADVYVSNDGGVSFALEENFPDENGIVAAVSPSAGVVYFGTLPHGQIWKRSADASYAKIYTGTDHDAGWTQIRWLLLHTDGEIYAGTGNVKASVLKRTDDATWPSIKDFAGEVVMGLLWSKAGYSNGDMFASTGDNASVYRWDGTTWYREIDPLCTNNTIRGYGLAEVGNILFFNAASGSDGPIYWRAHSRLQPKVDALTVSFWLYNDTFPDRINPIGKWATSSQSWGITSVASDDQRLRLYLSSTGLDAIVGATMADALVASTWYHITFVFDGVAQMSYCYVNGELVNSQAVALSALISNATGIRIGAHGNDVFWVDGKIDEVMTKEKVVSQAEDMAHYLSTKWRYS